MQVTRLMLTLPRVLEYGEQDQILAVLQTALSEYVTSREKVKDLPEIAQKHRLGAMLAQAVSSLDSASVDVAPPHNHFGEVFRSGSCPGCAWLKERSILNGANT